MPTFRDDVVNAGRRLLETVEERTGREVITSEERQLLESDRSERRRLEKTLDFLGFSLLNYDSGAAGLPGHPGGFELKPQVRRYIAQQSLAAWVQDPMIGNHVELYLSFVFGRGVPRPQAHDPEVQKHLDKTWDDPANKRVLTSYDKLLEKGIDLCLQANVYFKFFDEGQDGMVRVSLERFDDVEDVVRHSELASEGKGDRFRILYYRSKERRIRYSFSDGSRTSVAAGDPDPASTAKTVFYEAWGAFDDDDAVMARQDEGLRKPPERMRRQGKIVHLAVNKTSEMAFGVPRMQRYIDWATAYNEMIVAFRDRMKAMASVYMKATAKGGQRDLNRLGQMALGRTSAFGGSRDVADGPIPAPPSGPGILGQNESLNYEPFKIDSTAGDVAQAAPVMRGQLGGPWPDSYLSGFAEGAIAGAQSLELPTLKFVEREQELWVLGVLRPLGEASVARAVELGDITEWRDPTTAETEQIAAADEADEPLPLEVNPTTGQVKRDLCFDLALPSPLKRVMLDVVSSAVQVATAVDPNGENYELSRWLFSYILAEAFDVADPMRIVDKVLPRQPKPTPAEEAEAEGLDPETGLPVEGAIGPDGKRHTADNPSGAPVKAPQPEQRKVREAAVATAATDLLASISSNGNGAGGH